MIARARVVGTVAGIVCLLTSCTVQHQKRPVEPAQAYVYEKTIGGENIKHFDTQYLEYPASVAVDSVNDHILIGEYHGSHIKIFDRTSLRYLKTLGSDDRGNDAATFSSPADIAVDTAHNHIIIADSLNQRVQVLDARTFAYVGTLGTTGIRGNDNAHFDNPEGVAVSPPVGSSTGRIFIADLRNARIQVFDAENFYYIATVSAPNIIRPTGISYAPEIHRLLVSDLGPPRERAATVKMLDPETLAFLGSIGRPAPNVTRDDLAPFQPFGATHDVATDRILVSDPTNNRILAFDDQSYEFRSIWAAENSASPNSVEFVYPYAVATDVDRARLFVIEPQKRRVQVFKMAP